MNSVRIKMMIYLSFVIAFSVGWVLNLYQLATSEFILDGVTIIKIVGIFIAPLGSFMGYVG